MLIIGLTGSIGVGKTNVAREFRALHVPVFDADRAVHKMLSPGGEAVKKVAEIFPAALEKNQIDRKKLGDIVFGDKKKLQLLEKILHPLVRRAEKKFLQKAQGQKKKMAVLDIPLLFEKGFFRICDYTIVVVAPHFVQKHRVMRRRHMSHEKFLAIIASQMPQAKKMRLADFVIRAGLDKRSTNRQVRAIYAALCAK